MGIIVDTNTLVTAERRKHSVREIFTQIRESHGDMEAGLAAITVMELAHGIERAEAETQRERRRVFLNDLIADIEVYPVTKEIAWLAGRISGQQARRGIVMPFEDLLIGATALHHSFDVLTENVRHFEMIPDLVVKQL